MALFLSDGYLPPLRSFHRQAHPALAAKGILVNPSILHDQLQVPFRVRDEVDVGDRVAVVKKQVSEGILLDHA